ncbi:MAG: hypothetical protein CL395_08560 [Acidiferrobacteraceae bacterium]|jgi:hypothetical protein|nr:hypothetical protein [Acidiferrobacteraceae bacterium]MDP6095452.1 type VI secretion lipoprotein TssJ [Gammaproteobacteria bacterium]HJP07969.1 hypothetical protein [Arenicellales bacterium]|tara:strand:+ start:845 stop:1492 length:648 start_codon:yes stop_codon:yes gene_type:complete
MSIYLRFLSILMILVALTGCITRPVEVTRPLKLSQLTAGNIPEQKGALTVNIDAHNDLNWFENTNNGLTIGFLQTSSRGIISQLAKSSLGLQKILEKDLDDPAIISIDTFRVQPGSKTTVVLTRGELSKHLVIVAGYYDLKPGKSLLVFDTPVYLDRTYHADPIALFHNDTPMYSPYELIELKLGPQEILSEQTTSTTFWLEAPGLLGRFFYNVP